MTIQGLVALASLAGHTLVGQNLSAAQVARLVDMHYNHLRSLQARYTERYQGMGIDRTEAGTLILRKPGRMRWSYDNPAGKVFVLNGKDAVSYTPGDAQAHRIPARQLDDLRSPLRFLLGGAHLTRELDGLSVAPVAGGYSLAGAPHGMGSRIRAVVLLVDAQEGIHSLQFEDADGARTTFNFTDTHENVAAPESDFLFVPPPGVSVVDGAAPL